MVRIDRLFGEPFWLSSLLLFRTRVEFKTQAARISPLLLIREIPENKSDPKFSPPVQQLKEQELKLNRKMVVTLQMYFSQLCIQHLG